MGRLKRLVRRLLGKSDANDKASASRSNPNGKSPVSPPVRSFSPPRLPHPVQDRAAGAATGEFIGDEAPHSTGTTNKHNGVGVGGASAASEGQRLPGHGAGTSAQDARLPERNALSPPEPTHADRDLALSEQESNYSQPDAVHSEPKTDSAEREANHSQLTTEHAERGTTPLKPEGSSPAQNTKPDDYKMDLTNTTHVDQVTTQAPAVVHEHVYPTEHEIVERQVHRDIHEYHEVRYIQPVYEVEVLPARHLVPGPDGRLVEVAEKDLACVPMVR